jgi:cytochrome d ubiquinol oxidase subunit II
VHSGTALFTLIGFCGIYLVPRRAVLFLIRREISPDRSRRPPMVELWYFLVALMLTLYVVMDGFDLAPARCTVRRAHERGAPSGARGDRAVLGRQRGLAARDRRRDVRGVPPVFLRQDSPVSTSAIFLSAGALILRGISIEFRSHVVDPIWRALCGRGPGVASIPAGGLLRARRSATCFAACRLTIAAGSVSRCSRFPRRAPVGILDWYSGARRRLRARGVDASRALFLAWENRRPGPRA